MPKPPDPDPKSIDPYNCEVKPENDWIIRNCKLSKKKGWFYKKDNL
jgi:hypothetical protein